MTDAASAVFAVFAGLAGVLIAFLVVAAWDFVLASFEGAASVAVEDELGAGTSSFLPRVATKAAEMATSPSRARSMGRGSDSDISPDVSAAAGRMFRSAARYGCYPVAARLMASIGAGLPVQRSRLRAPWRTSTSTPSITRAPAREAQAQSAVSAPA